MKKLLLVATLVLSSQTAMAEDLEVIDCAVSGNRTIDTQVSEDSGEFTIAVEINACKMAENHESNGSIVSSGVIDFNNRDLSVDVIAISESNITVTASNNTSATHICSRNVDGSYSLMDSAFEGNITTQCNQSGNFEGALLDLLTELQNLDIEQLINSRRP